MHRILALLLLLAPVACQAPADRDGASPAERTGEIDLVGAEDRAATARDLVHDFHRALSEGDSARVIELLHRDAVIYEAGHAETVDEYRAGHLGADIRFAAATEREVLDERVMLVSEVVVYLSETRVRGAVGERDIDSRGVETIVLAPDGDRWLIRHIHWSNR